MILVIWYTMLVSVSRFLHYLFIVFFSSHFRCVQIPTKKQTNTKTKTSENRHQQCASRHTHCQKSHFCWTVLGRPPSQPGHCSIPTAAQTPHHYGNPIPPERQSGSREVWKLRAFVSPLPLPFISVILCTFFYLALCLSLSFYQQAPDAKLDLINIS